MLEAGSVVHAFRLAALAAVSPWVAAVIWRAAIAIMLVGFVGGLVMGADRDIQLARSILNTAGRVSRHRVGISGRDRKALFRERSIGVCLTIYGVI